MDGTGKGYVGTGPSSEINTGREGRAEIRRESRV